ncbi:fluoride efflux transporter CrcB [Acinetobacter apis]
MEKDMFYPLLAIALGSVLGGWLRWFIGLRLNTIYPAIPLGTVCVNLVGGFIIGFAIAFFAQSQMSANYKLFLITGFCGGLTTFSTFSAEIVALLQQGRFGMAMAAISIHVIGALAFTFLGMLTYQWISQN